MFFFECGLVVYEKYVNYFLLDLSKIILKDGRKNFILGMKNRL